MPNNEDVMTGTILNFYHRLVQEVDNHFRRYSHAYWYRITQILMVKVVKLKSVPRMSNEMYYVLMESMLIPVGAFSLLALMWGGCVTCDQ